MQHKQADEDRILKYIRILLDRGRTLESIGPRQPEHRDWPGSGSQPAARFWWRASEPEFWQRAFSLPNDI